MKSKFGPVYDRSLSTFFRHFINYSERSSIFSGSSNAVKHRNKNRFRRITFQPFFQLLFSITTNIVRCKRQTVIKHKKILKTIIFSGKQQRVINSKHFRKYCTIYYDFLVLLAKPSTKGSI